MLLEIKNLQKVFPKTGPQGSDVKIFDNANFKLDKAETVAVIGRSGSGKSTFLSMLSGIDASYQGNILFNDLDLKTLSQKNLSELRAKHIGIIFQQYHLMEHLTALENVMLPLEIIAEDRPKVKALELLSNVGLSQRVNYLPGRLSGGERQRVAIARAISTKRQLILADEPTGSLDQASGDIVIDMLFDLVKHYNSSLILVTHSLDIAKKADRTLLIDAGKLVTQK